MRGAAGKPITSRGRRIDDADFRQLVEDAKAQWNISDVVSRRAKLRRAGRETVTLCLFHPERSPSMRVNDAKGTYHCFGCGASGDIVTLVMATEGLSFMDALRWLGAANLPSVAPELRARAAEEDAAERAAAIAEARAVWNGASATTGTPAETYARSRGITMPLPPSIRFTNTYAWRDKETGEAGPDLPAMVGAVTNGAGEVVAIQRIFLRDGGMAKAALKKPKLSLGRVKGGALKLEGACMMKAPSELIITEGPEDGLTLAQEMPGQRVWVALGTALMPFIEYPTSVRVVTLAGDNNDAGRAAVRKAAEEIEKRGIVAKIIFPPPGYADFNDQLRGIRA